MKPSNFFVFIEIMILLVPLYTSCGTSADTPDKPCETVHCSGHGVCAILEGAPFCVCDDGYRAEGMSCVEVPDPCSGIFCSGHGTCGVTIDGDAICACDQGYRNEGIDSCVPETAVEICSEDGWCFINPSPYSGTLHDVWGFSTNDVWLVGAKYYSALDVLIGKILHWDGSDWTEVLSIPGIVLFGIWGITPNDLWAVGYNNSLQLGHILHWDGTSWSNVDSGTTEILHDIWGASSDDVWVVGGDNGTILHWAGSDWSAIDTGIISGTLESVWGSASDDIWAVGWYNTILRWDGSSWSWYNGSPPIDVDWNYYGVFGTSTSDLWIVGQDLISEFGCASHWDGAVWSFEPITVEGRFNDVWGSTQNDFWVVGDQGSIYWKDGQSWIEMNSGTSNNLYGIWGFEDHIWIVGEEGTILHKNRL